MMKTNNIVKAPNQEYLEMNFVAETATGRGNNQQFIMENLHDGTFRATEARVGITVGRHKPRHRILPMEQWEEVFQAKCSRGYLLTKTEKMEKISFSANRSTVNGQAFAPVQDPSVQEIITRLLSYTDAVLEQNYTVRMENVSDEMIRYGRNVLDDLALHFHEMSVAEFNNKLRSLYAAVPRRMDNLSKYLAKRKLDMNDIVAEEQELFDVMLSRLRPGDRTKNGKLTTVLDAFHLDWREVTGDEESVILDMLKGNAGQYVKAWKITNHRAEDKFQEFCNKESLTDEDGITRLFHGSRSCNFWSILTNGLTINPTNVQINGKMFGNGTYFAPKAQKSLNYTSRQGSLYTNGDSSTGFLGIFKVATGKHYDIEIAQTDLTWSLLQQRCPGAHCAWAHAGRSLVNDEVIVYQDCQSSIEYLVEVSV